MPIPGGNPDPGALRRIARRSAETTTAADLATRTAVNPFDLVEEQTRPSRDLFLEEQHRSSLSNNPFDLAEREAGQEAFDLQVAHYAAQRRTPDRSAELLRLQAKTGLPADLIDEQYDLVRTESARQDFDAERFRVENPVIASWYRDVDNAVLATDDLDALSGLEWAFAAGRRALESGTNNVELGLLRFAQLAGVASPDQVARAEELSRTRYTGTYGARNVLTRSVTGTAEQLPMMAYSMLARAAGGVVGGSLAVVGGQAGPQVAAPEEILTVPAGVASGQTVGGVAAAYALEAGLSYDDLLHLQDRNGLPLPPAKAMAAAHAVGLVNGLLEVAGFDTVLSTIPGARVFKTTLTRAGLERVTGSASVRAAKRIAGATAAETGTEVLQEISGVLGEEIAKTGQSFDRPTAEQVLTRLASVAQRTAESSWLVPTGGAVLAHVDDARAARAGQAAERQLEALAESAQASKLRTRSPERFEAIVRAAAEAGETQTVYLESARWDAYWQARGKDPRQVAAELLGSDGAELYDEASIGGDLEIPVERWLSTIAPSEHHGELMLDARLREDAMTPRQARAWLERQQAFAADDSMIPPRSPEGEPQPDRAPLEQVQQTPAAEPLFGDGSSLMDLEREPYRALVAAARAEAEQEFVAIVAREKQIEAERIRDEETERIRAEVAAEIDGTPVYQVQRFLRQGIVPEGMALPPELAGVKLSGAAIGAMYGTDPEFAQKLRRLSFMFSATGGVHPDVVAEAFGFGSGDEMMRALFESEARGRTITRVTAERVREKLGEPMPAEKLLGLARDAVHGERRAELLEYEVRRLARRAKRLPTAAATIRAAAQNYIGRRALGQLRPDVYARVGEQAARAAFRAAAAQDWTEALQQKVRQLRSLYLYRAARDAKRDGEAAVRYLRKMTRESSRARLGRAGADFLDQVDTLLERFDFKPASRKAIGERQQLRAWLEEQAGQVPEFVPAIDEKILDETRLVSWRELPVGDVLALRDAVLNIERLARLKTTVDLESGEREFETLVGDLLGKLQESHPVEGRFRLSRQAESIIARLQETGRTLDAAHVPLEELVLSLDGNDPNGPFASVLVHPNADAAAYERELSARVTAPIKAKIVDMPAELRRRLAGETRYIQAIDQTLSMREILAVALNVGNESNRAKLLGGYLTDLGDLKPWDEQALEEILGHLTREDWNLVQAVWDTLEAELWPLIARQQREMTGLEPPKVEAVPFTRKLADGSTIELRGGYYPVVYDERLSRQGRLQDSENIADQFDAGNVQWVTRHGHTIGRVEKFARPIKLDPFVLPAHVATVTHDLAYRRRLMTAWRVVNEPRVQVEIIRRLGKPYHDAILGRIKRTANARVYDSALVAATYGKLALEKFRSAMVGGALAYNAAVILQNLANVGPAVAASGGNPKWLLLGVDEMLRQRGDLVSWIKENSGEMRHRFEQRDQNVATEFDRLFRRTSTVDDLRRWGLGLGGYTDAAVAYPLWYGAYRKGLAEGLEHGGAVRAADAAVRQALGSGQTWNLSDVQDSQYLRYFTMFASWFLNAVYRQQRRAIRDAREDVRAQRYAVAALRFTWNELLYLFVPAVIGSALMGKAPGQDDDDETAAGWIARQIALYLAGVFPIVRDAAAAIDRGGDVRLSPIVTPIDKAVKAERSLERAARGEAEWGDAFTAGAEATAYALGIPGVAQAKRTGGYLVDVVTGEAEPENAGDVATGLLYPRSRERRKERR